MKLDVKSRFQVKWVISAVYLQDESTFFEDSEPQQSLTFPFGKFMSVVGDAIVSVDLNNCKFGLAGSGSGLQQFLTWQLLVPD